MGGQVRGDAQNGATAGVAEDPIETVWGVGYKWVAK